MQICPPTVLQRVIDRLVKLGYEASVGVELEAMIFEGACSEARRNPAELQPLSVGPTYSNGRAAQDEAVLGSVRRQLEGASIQVESSMAALLSGAGHGLERQLEPPDRGRRGLRAAVAGAGARQLNQAIGLIDGSHSPVSGWARSSSTSTPRPATPTPRRIYWH